MIAQHVASEKYFGIIHRPHCGKERISLGHVRHTGSALSDAAALSCFTDGLNIVKEKDEAVNDFT